MYNMYKRPKESPKRMKFGDVSFHLVNEVFTKREAEKIKNQMKMSDPRLKVRIVKRKWDLRNVYSIYAYGEI
jgi:hypothetical protein